MVVSKDIQLLLEGVHHYLSVVLPRHPLSEPAEQQRVHLLDQLREVALRYPAVSFGGHKASDFDSTECIEQNQAATREKCDPSALTGLALVAGAKRVVKRSGSVSSRSSSGSYTSTSYTSNGYTSTSYTSNGYGSYEGGCGQSSAPVQEDIYEEFDAVQLRIPGDQSACACPSSSVANSASSSSSSSFSHSSPFFASLRSSLSYGKKDKKDMSPKSSKSDDSKSKKNERQSKGKSMEDLSTSKLRRSTKERSGKHSLSESENKIAGVGEKIDGTESTRQSSLCGQNLVPENGHVRNGLDEKSEWEVQSEKESKFSLEERRSSGVESVGGLEEEIENSYMEGLQPISFSSNIACCSHHGVLQKKTKRLLRQWRPYQGVVSNGVLFLYNKETDHRQSKSLELCCYDVRVATGEEAGHQLQLGRDSALLELVAPGKKTHTFMARSVSDRDTWIQAVGQYTKNRACLPLTASRLHSLPSAPGDHDTASGKPSDATSVACETDFSKNEGNVDQKNGGAHDRKWDSARRTSENNKKNSETSSKFDGKNVPMLSRGGSTTSLGTNPLFSFTIKSPNRSGVPVAGPAAGVCVSDDVCSFPASCDDTFSSEEMYEEVNMEEIRCSSGPSLSEMLEPHLGHLTGAYYCVPLENTAKDCPGTSTPAAPQSDSDDKHLPVSCPVTPCRDTKQAPARPPPPNFSTEKLVKNNSALHHRIISPKNSLLNVFSGLSKPGDTVTPPSVCRRLPFSSSARPLPETPQEVPEEGEIYDEIDEDDYYEESEADGTSLENASQVSKPTSTKKNYSVLNPPPPLPLRGPPPIPSLPPPTTSSKNDVLASDLSLFEDYDVPDDVSKMITVDKSSGDDYLTSPRRPDLSIDLPPFLSSNYSGSSESTSDSAQKDSRTSNNTSDNVYKVPNPTIPVSEEVYKIPSSIPIPVGNNNEKFPCKSKSEISACVSDSSETRRTVVRPGTNYGTDTSKPDLATSVKASVSPSCELYQSPPSKSIPVSPLLSNAIIGSYSRSKPNAFDELKKSKDQSVNSNANFTGFRKLETLKNGGGNVSNNIRCEIEKCNSSPQKPNSNVSVKERIALLNQNKTCESTASPPRVPATSPDQLVMLLDHKEIRLDQAKKKAFLESTLNFTNTNQTKLDVSPLKLTSSR